MINCQLLTKFLIYFHIKIYLIIFFTVFLLFFRQDCLLSCLFSVAATFLFGVTNAYFGWSGSKDYNFLDERLVPESYVSTSFYICEMLGAQSTILVWITSTSLASLDPIIYMQLKWRQIMVEGFLHEVISIMN